MAKDVIVVVQRDALPSEKESLDILLVSTAGEYAVDTYRDVASVEAVYGENGACPNAKVVRKATTLFNQGKTSLADTLISKLKIVSFAEPSTPDDLIKSIQTFQSDVDNDWYYLLTDKDDDEYITALAKFAEASEPTEAELGAGVEDHRKFYMGQTINKKFASDTARAAVIYADADDIDEEPDASYTGNVGPFYPTSVTWKFKRPQDGNAPTSAGTKLITLPKLTEGERSQLLENHVNFLTEEYKRQYVKDGTCLDGEFIDVVLGGDWIAKRMRDLLYDILLENANINYDDAGFGLIATAVLQALNEAVDYNIIAVDAESKKGEFSVTIPKYSDSTEDQRRNRVMPDITWEALLSGAIHQVKTKGVLRASL